MKNLLKLVKLQNLVTKCTLQNTENISLRSLQTLYMFVLRAEIVTIFEPKMVTISARNTNIYKLCKVIFSKLYNILQPNFAILLISLCSF
jgi:hypothetical protein